ncbi:hypothetical protein LINPERPRIM_LOCUS11964 [Linum perenne]
MGYCKGCGKLGRMAQRDQSVSGYHFAIMLSPVISFWDCIVRKMRYSHRLDSLAANKMQPPAVRKVKKKEVKGELDRLKQAEKKKRRLEKALATSAAIRSELEKKKQKKKEEQQRLDEEGAAIAEAVALHVLLGEDSDESCQIVFNKEDRFVNPWDRAGNVNFYMDKRRGGGTTTFLPRQDFSRHSLEKIGWIPNNNYSSGYNADNNGEWSSFSFNSLGRNVRGGGGGGNGLIAAQAVSSLRIREDAAVVDAYVLDGMLRG